MVNESYNFSYPIEILFGFIAGFLGTMIFHQLVLALLWAVGFAPLKPFSMDSTQPLGVPSVISLSFWGGVWGIIYVLIHTKFSLLGNYWLISFLFGAILPSLVALLLVFPLKGRPIMGGWDPKLLLIVFIINGAWGIGTGFFIKALSAMYGKS